jgi:5-methylcytosine-specific restriction protein A
MGLRRHPDFGAQYRRGPRWKALRLAALRRDGFRCRECGVRGKLEVDHVKPVRDFPDLAFDLANLQALCARCHGSKTRRDLGMPPPCPKRAAWRAAVAELQPKLKGVLHA